MQFISATLRHLRAGLHSELLGRRSYFTSGEVCSKYVDKLVRRYFINNNAGKKKRRWQEEKMIENPVSLSQPQMKGEKNSHRLHVLNRVFMKKICDILSTGTYSAVLMGYGIEISKVRVVAGMTSVNVHWFCTGSDVDDTVQKLLERHASYIRFELNKQNLIGTVPPIVFVKDHRYYKLMEVERCLSLTDYGEDFVPLDPAHHLKTNLVVKEKFTDQIKSEIEICQEVKEEFFVEALKLSSSLSHGMEEEKAAAADLPTDLPVMRDAILGVGHKRIYTLVRQGLTKAKAKHRESNDESLSLCSSSFSSEFSAPSRTEEIRNWMKKYKLQRKKERRAHEMDESVLLLPLQDDECDEDTVLEDESDYIEEYDLLEEYESNCNKEYDILEEERNYHIDKQLDLLE